MKLYWWHNHVCGPARPGSQHVSWVAWCKRRPHAGEDLHQKALEYLGFLRNCLLKKTHLRKLILFSK